MGKGPLSIWNALVRVFCAVSLVCSVFAHQMPAAEASSETVASFGSMPDGTAITICKADRDKTNEHSLKASVCLFCCFSAGFDLPKPNPDISRKLSIATALVSAHLVEVFRPVHAAQNASPRGPPASV